MKNNYLSSITSKGQVTIPTIIREKMQINNKSKIEFIIQDNCILMVPINSSITNLQGVLSRPSKPLSVEEMDEVIRNKEAR